VILIGPSSREGGQGINVLLPSGLDSPYPPWRARHRSISHAAAIFALEVALNPATTGYVNRNVDPRFTEPYNTMIYKEINRKKD
jgi:hypothetical protein